MEILTSEDFKGFMRFLINSQESLYTGGLEEYLRSLWRVLLNYHNEPLSYGLFAKIFQESFSAEALPFDQAWLDYIQPPSVDEIFSSTSFSCLERFILFQIADLRRMVGNQLDNPYRYLRVTSPTGNNWCNFDPFLFLRQAFAIYNTESEQGNQENEETPTWNFLITGLLYGQDYE